MISENEKKNGKFLIQGPMSEMSISGLVEDTYIFKKKKKNYFNCKLITISITLIRRVSHKRYIAKNTGKICNTLISLMRSKTETSSILTTTPEVGHYSPPLLSQLA